MKIQHWIDGNLWLGWNADQRAQVYADLDAQGIQWGINFIDCKHDYAHEAQRDKDGYRDEQSLGGKWYKGR